MTKIDEDWNGLRYGFLQYCWAEQFLTFILFAWNFKLLRPGDSFSCNEDMVLSFRSIEIISLQTLSFIACIRAERKNKLNSAVTQFL